MKDVAVWLRTGLCDPDGLVLTIINRERPQVWMDRWIEGRKRERKARQERKTETERRERDNGKLKEEWTFREKWEADRQKLEEVLVNDGAERHQIIQNESNRGVSDCIIKVHIHMLRLWNVENTACRLLLSKSMRCVQQTSWWLEGIQMK